MTIREMMASWLRDSAEELKDMADRLEQGEDWIEIMTEASAKANDVVKLVVEWGGKGK